MKTKLMAIVAALLMALPVMAGDNTACNVKWTTDLPPHTQLSYDVTNVPFLAFRYCYLQGMMFPEGTRVHMVGSDDRNARPLTVWDGEKWLITLPPLHTRYTGKTMFQLGHELGHVWLNSKKAQYTPGIEMQQQEAFCGWFAARCVQELADYYSTAPVVPLEANKEFGKKLQSYNAEMIPTFEEVTKLKADAVKKTALKDFGKLEHDAAAFYGHLMSETKYTEVLAKLGITFKKEPRWEMDWNDVKNWKPGDPMPEKKLVKAE